MNRIGTLALLVVLATRALALDPARALTQSRLSVWTSESGLPQNTIDAIVQTRDGYLWLGTEEGLARFDGVRFIVSDRQTAPALRSAFISSLFEAPDGTLWIGTYGGGLARLRNDRIEAFRAEVLGSDRLREMHAAPHGIYIATAGGGLLRIDGDKVTRFTAQHGLPTVRIWAIEDDGEGGLWIATHGGGVVRWRNDRVDGRVTGLPNGFARALLRDRDGTLWIGTDGGGLASWRNGAIARVLTTRDGLPNDFVRTLLRDRDGSLWIGTDGGLARLNGDRIESIGVEEGLPSAAIRVIVEDREGSLWIGTTGGLVRLRDTRVVSLTRKEGLPVPTIRAVLEDRRGTVWLGTEGGGLCDASSLRCFTRRDGLPNESIYALAESRDGSLWIGTDGGGVTRLRDGRFVETIAGLPNDRVRAIVETANNDLWISTSAGLARVRDGRVTRIKEFEDKQLRPVHALDDGALLVGTDGAGVWRVDGTRVTLVAKAGHGLESDRVFSLTRDSGGNAVWIGTSGGGLSRLDLETNDVRTLTRRNGLYDDVVFEVVDGGADLWLTSNRGVYRVDRTRVLAAMNGARADLTGTVYGIADGLPSAECVGAFPAAMRAKNGHVWVATARGVAVIDPAAMMRNPVPPPVQMEEALIDGVKAPAGPLRVPPGTQRIELRYTALALRAPERVTFRYLLDGYDDDWVAAGTSRVAHYTKLAPGDYTFRVIATNEDGVRSREEARLAVRVDPRWFETWWARLLALALLLAMIWAAVRWRANAVLAKLSFIDGLTGIANRRRFDEALEEACAAGTLLSLVLIDLDHFKRLNDTQGHQSGDHALRAVASLLDKCAKSRGGLIARFGGEEFAWLLPDVSLNDAVREAGELRARVAASGIVTASLGVAASNGTMRPAELVAAADAALYRAKSRGRDRVEAEPVDASPRLRRLP